MTYKFKMNDKVFFDYAPVKGIGIVKGVATVEMAVIGATYIIEAPSIYSEYYPFTHIVVPEIHLSKEGVEQ